MSIKRFSDFQFHQGPVAPVTDTSVLLAPGDMLVGYAKDANGNSTGEIRTRIKDIADFTNAAYPSVVPVGAVIAFAQPPSVDSPLGWLVCNGASVSIQTYNNLYQALNNGTIFGLDPNNSSNFLLPDLRGLFIRGYGTGDKTGASSGSFGVAQDDSFKSHSHNISITDSTAVKVTPNNKGSYQGVFISTSRRPATPGTDSIDGVAAGVNFIDNNKSSFNRGSISASTTSSGIISNTGDTETRPKNMALRYLIKY